jgi:hypothetical protein
MHKRDGLFRIRKVKRSRGMTRDFLLRKGEVILIVFPVRLARAKLNDLFYKSAFPLN